MKSFIFWSLFTACMAATSQSCNDALIVNPKLCFNLQQVQNSNAFCRSETCLASECCRDPQTCGEANLFNNVQYHCFAEFQSFNSSGVCQGSMCNNTRTCCKPFDNCLAIYDSGVPCPKAGEIRDSKASCVAPCLINDCCRAAVSNQTCGDFLAAQDAAYCTVRGLVDAESTKTCAGGVCDGPQCCIRQAQSCSDLARQMYPSSDLCTRNQLVFDVNSVTFSDSCPATGCESTRCCKRPTTCGEFQEATGINICSHQSPPGILVDSQACSGSDCKNSTKCCHSPTSCVEADYAADYGFCGAGTMKNASNFIFFMEPCPGGRCTKERCCVPTQTCSEADGSISDYSSWVSYQCRTRQLAFNGQQPCTYGVNCTVNVCCAPPDATCQAVQAIDPNIASRWCGLDGKYFDSTASCQGGCTASQCCIYPTSCFEYSTAQPQLCRPGVFLPTLPTDEPCSEGKCEPKQCCRPAYSCREASVTCGPMQSLDAAKPCFESCTPDVCCLPAQNCGDAGWKERCTEQGKIVAYDEPCTGSGCNVSTCCKSPNTCSDFLSGGSGISTCVLAGRVPNHSNEACNGMCSAEQCCSPPTTCGDANVLTLYRLCFNQGVINPSVLCTESGCTPEKCCLRPRTCADVRASTSILESDSLWCSRDQFVDNFDFVICESICTPAECCRQINTCDEWKEVYDRNQPSTILPPTPICRYGAFNTGGSCDGPCDEKQCCRAPKTCEEAQVPCPVGEVLKPQEFCDGVSCNAVTCCLKPTTCNEVAHDKFFCFAAGMVIREPTADPIVCPSGRCTPNECCRPVKNCEEAYFTTYTCPDSSYPLNPNTPCTGTGCNMDTCCGRPADCITAVAIDKDYCKGFGFINSAIVAFTPCADNKCTQDQCCRPASTCGEAAAVLCGGAVNFFKPCSEQECSSSSHCCREPSNCKEAIGYKNVTCPSGSIPVNLNLATCPLGGCTVATCCKRAETCRDATTAGSIQCKAPAVILQDQVCGGSAPACNADTCCKNTTTCKEAVASVTASGVQFCSNPFPVVNSSAQADVCSPSCDQKRCCRAPFDCREAFLLNPKFCDASKQAFNFSAGHLKCENDDCVRTCCINPRTFAPTPFPSQRPSTDGSSAKPTSRPNTDGSSAQPTSRPNTDGSSAQPTSRPNTDNTPTNKPTTGKCPEAAFDELVKVCFDGDFEPYQLPVNCTAECKKSAANLLRILASYDVSIADGCLREALARYPLRNYKSLTIDFLKKQFTLRAPICEAVVNSSPVLGVSLFMLSLLALVA